MFTNSKKTAKIVLANGVEFCGTSIGAKGTTIGELVFTTSMTGYLETLTDASYFGQIVLQTFPLIGNYGINLKDYEGKKPHLFGYIVKELCNNPSNLKNKENLNDWLLAHNIVAIKDVDTRSLTKKIRDEGVLNAAITTEKSDFVKIIPYIVVLIMAIAGTNVLAVLTLGVFLCCLIGVVSGEQTVFQSASSMGDGMLSMSELIIITMIAGGLLEIIKQYGGIEFIIQRMRRRISGKRGAELSIAGLIALVNICTANNTVAIITVGDIARQIGKNDSVDKRKIASILDTVSCSVQGLLPYGAQVLMAAGLAGVGPDKIIPNLIYPMAIGVATVIAILVRYPKKYS